MNMAINCILLYMLTTKSVQMVESKSQSRIVIKFAFLIPYYNHPKTIKSLVDYLSKYNIDIIVVDDGSDHKSKEALKNLNIHYYLKMNSQ